MEINHTGNENIFIAFYASVLNVKICNLLSSDSMKNLISVQIFALNDDRNHQPPLPGPDLVPATRTPERIQRP